MTTPVIIDVIMAVVLIAAVIYGAHRGLFRALAGLAVVIVALVGAAIIANTLAAPAARLVTPLIREQIETKVDEAMARQAQEVQMPEEDVDEGFAIEDLLALMGLDEDVRNSLASQTQEKIQDTGVSLVMAVVESLAQSILYAALFLVSLRGTDDPAEAADPGYGPGAAAAGAAPGQLPGRRRDRPDRGGLGAVSGHLGSAALRRLL